MAILEVRNINKSFGNNHVLQGIDFSLEEGKVLSIIGSSGSGKTTLLRCITSLETADKGQIIVNGNVVFEETRQGDTVINRAEYIYEPFEVKK